MSSVRFYIVISDSMFIIKKNSAQEHKKVGVVDVSLLCWNL